MTDRRYTVTVVRTITEEATVSFVLPPGEYDLTQVAAAHVTFGGWGKHRISLDRTSVTSENVIVSVPDAAPVKP